MLNLATAVCETEAASYVNISRNGFCRLLESGGVAAIPETANKAKVRMANTPGMPDDDILDLTEVVERHDAPAPSFGAPSSGNPPDPGDDSIGADFGADLDALLDSLTANQASPAATPPAPQKSAAPAHPVAAPIENPTPAGHRVDPDESLPDADSADIDSLLAELGVDTPKTARPAPEPPAAEPQASEPQASEPQASGPPARDRDGYSQSADILDELPDDIMAMIDTGMAAVAEESPPVPGPESVTPESVPESAPEFAPESVSPSPEQTESAPDVPDAPAPLASAVPPAPAAPLAPAAVAPSLAEETAEKPGGAAHGASGNDTIDLNELDALLDDMLATAPATRAMEPAPVPAPAPDDVPARADAPGASFRDVPDLSLEPRLSALEAAFAIMRAGTGEETFPKDAARERLDGFEARLDALEGAFAALRAMEDARDAVEKASEAAPPAGTERAMTESAGPERAMTEPAGTEPAGPAAIVAVVEDLFLPGSPLTERVTLAVCAALAAAEQDASANAAPLAGTEDLPAAVAAVVEDLFLPGSPLTERVARAACAALTGVNAAGCEDAAALFRAELEKMTASAAARVIREELRALADLSGAPSEREPDQAPGLPEDNE